MELFRLFLRLVIWVSAIFILIGLYKPWVMLWWEHTQTRKKVIQLYGSILLVSTVLTFVLKILNNDT